MTVTQVSEGAGRYAGEVRAALADLPGHEVAELGEDLDGHLADLGRESGETATYEVLRARLGPPAAYAAELRRAAGLPPRPGGAVPPGVHPAWRVVSVWWLAAVAIPTVPAVGYSVLEAMSSLSSIGPWQLGLLALLVFGWLPGITALWIASNRFPRARDVADGLAFRGPGRSDGSPEELTWMVRFFVVLSALVLAFAPGGWTTPWLLVPLWVVAVIVFGAVHQRAPWQPAYYRAVADLPDIVRLRRLFARLRGSAPSR